MNWPEAHLELLKKLWAGSGSSSYIAGEINKAFPGSGYTRNSIIGKAHRLRLPSRDKKIRSTPMRKATPQRTVPFKAPPVPKSTPPDSLPPPEALPEEPPLPQDCEPVGIMQLEKGMCKWVVSLGPAMYCGIHTSNTYCTAHAPPGRPREERKSRPRHYTPSHRED